ncbi:MAG: flagellar hook-length control protein FliK [Peptococcaceae bacterium]|jgi:hypothetical protein|nr:flagellar hook-length control protein FliK [Peptococcaceae bacterium]
MSVNMSAAVSPGLEPGQISAGGQGQAAVSGLGGDSAGFARVLWQMTAGAGGENGGELLAQLGRPAGAEEKRPGTAAEQWAALLAALGFAGPGLTVGQTDPQAIVQYLAEAAQAGLTAAEALPATAGLSGWMAAAGLTAASAWPEAAQLSGSADEGSADLFALWAAASQGGGATVSPELAAAAILSGGQPAAETLPAAVLAWRPATATGTIPTAAAGRAGQTTSEWAAIDPEQGGPIQVTVGRAEGEAKASDWGLLGERERFQQAVREAKDQLAQREEGASQNEKAAAFSIEALTRPLTKVEVGGPGLVPADDGIPDQIFQGLSQNLAAGKGEFVLRLRPEGLGEVTVKLAASAGKTTLRIITASQATARLINQELPALRAALSPIQVEVREAVPGAAADGEAAFRQEYYMADQQGERRQEQGRQSHFDGGGWEEALAEVSGGGLADGELDTYI